jgi:putative selenium metabolism protein SsnA
MSRTIIENAILHTGETVVSPATVVMEGDTVTGVGTWTDVEAKTDVAPPPIVPRDGDRRIDAGGRLVTPGLVNAHTHIYSALARGIALKDPPPTRFVEILERLWWRLDRALDLEAIELSARLHGLECLRAGVTTVFDHHASQRAIRGSLETISNALVDSGLRACLCFEVTDRDGPAAAAAGIEENAAFLHRNVRHSVAQGAMRRGLFGLHAPFTLSDETLRACTREAGSGAAGFHVHLAEGQEDSPDAARRLRDAGILGKRTICVHGVHLDDTQLDILASTGTWLVHCPESNMNNAVGVATPRRLVDAGVRLALGTDGFTAAMAREVLVAHLMQNHLCASPGSGYETVPHLLLGANAELARESFGIDLGLIRTGAPADLVIWDYHPPTPITAENFHGHVIFGLAASQAAEVWIAGRQVWSGGHAVYEDEAELAKHCRNAAARLWERF